MAWRTCEVCGTPTKGPRCARHPRTNSTGRNGSTRAWRKLRAQVLERDGHACFWCGDRATHVDHVVPVARGGTDDPSNLVASCQRCNLKRGASLDSPNLPEIFRKVATRAPSEGAGGPQDHKNPSRADTAQVLRAKNRPDAGMF